MKKQTEKTMENDTESGIMYGFVGNISAIFKNSLTKAASRVHKGVPLEV